MVRFIDDSELFAYGANMLRSLLPVSALMATIAACSPAEPPLLIDGGRAPATDIGQGPASAESPRPSDQNTAASR